MADTVSYVLIAIAVSVLVLAVPMWRAHVRTRQRLDDTFHAIDLLLRQRQDALPDLVAVCRAFLRFPRESVEHLAQLRQVLLQGTLPLGQRVLYENEVSEFIGNVAREIDRFPELKANDALMNVQLRIMGFESAIADRREAFNEAVLRHNRTGRTWMLHPIAWLFGRRRLPCLALTSEELVQDSSPFEHAMATA